MTLRAINTPAVSEKADADVVAFLESALARARAGEIRGAVLITEDFDRDDERHGSNWSVAGVKDRWKVIGYLTWAIHKLVDA